VKRAINESGNGDLSLSTILWSEKIVLRETPPQYSALPIVRSKKEWNANRVHLFGHNDSPMTQCRLPGISLRTLDITSSLSRFQTGIGSSSSFLLLSQLVLLPASRFEERQLVGNSHRILCRCVLLRLFQAFDIDGELDLVSPLSTAEKKHANFVSVSVSASASASVVEVGKT